MDGNARAKFNGDIDGDIDIDARFERIMISGDKSSESALNEADEIDQSVADAKVIRRAVFNSGKASAQDNTGEILDLSGEVEEVVDETLSSLEQIKPEDKIADAAVIDEAVSYVGRDVLTSDRLSGILDFVDKANEAEKSTIEPAASLTRDSTKTALCSSPKEEKEPDFSPLHFFNQEVTGMINAHPILEMREPLLKRWKPLFEEADALIEASNKLPRESFEALYNDLLQNADSFSKELKHFYEESHANKVKLIKSQLDVMLGRTKLFSEVKIKAREERERTEFETEELPRIKEEIFAPYKDIQGINSGNNDRYAVSGTI